MQSQLKHGGSWGSAPGAVTSEVNIGAGTNRERKTRCMCLY